MTVLVTGGAGFFGNHMAERLVNGGNEIVVFDNFSTGRRDFLSGIDCKIIEGDVLNAEQISAAVKGVTDVFHFVGDINVRGSVTNPIANFNTEVNGTLNTLEACRRNDVKSFVYSSSFWVYGNPQIVPTPETSPIRPINNYGAAKAACEAYTSSYSELYGISSTVLRYTAIMGPKLVARVVYDLFMKLKKNPNELEIFGDGSRTRGFVHVFDCVEGILVAKKAAAKPYDVFNIGSDDAITIKEIADLLVEMMQLKNVKYKFTGGSVGWKGDVAVMIESSEKLTKYGWHPRFTSRQAVIDSINWLIENVK